MPDIQHPPARLTLYSCQHKDRGGVLHPCSRAHRALDDAGLDPGLADRAAADPAYVERVAAEHRELVDDTRSFGVPTLVLDGGDGPAIFGPVITEPPTSDSDAVELLRHVVWLARYPGFAELKRERDALPDLESVRQWSTEPSSS